MLLCIQQEVDCYLFAQVKDQTCFPKTDSTKFSSLSSLKQLVSYNNINSPCRFKPTFFRMTYYISVTGLTIKNVFSVPKFWKHAITSYIQAENAEGNIRVMTTSRGMYQQHTLTVWKDRKSMTKFMASGAHAQAMKVSADISVPGGTKVYGYESDTIPTWDEALALWDEHGKRHGKKVPNNKEQLPSKSSLLSTGAFALGLTVTLILAASNSYLQYTSSLGSPETVV